MYVWDERPQAKCQTIATMGPASAGQAAPAELLYNCRIQDDTKLRHVQSMAS